MGQAVVQVDAFAEAPGAGNPAAVCVLERERDAAWMQLVAREMNLSETAFVTPRADGYGLRWFTPAVEVDLCGHATLASAHVLFEAGLAGDARFHTRSGLLIARRDGDLVELDFPETALTPAEPPRALLEALRAESRVVLRAGPDWLVELESARAVRELRPDVRALRSIPVRGVIVTARGDDARFDFVSRFFAPGSGVDEDPVTGSAHCALAPFWAERLGRPDLVGFQASARGGVVHVRRRPPRVLLRGRAVTVMRGELLF